MSASPGAGPRAAAMQSTGDLADIHERTRQQPAARGNGPAAAAHYDASAKETVMRIGVSRNRAVAMLVGAMAVMPLCESALAQRGASLKRLLTLGRPSNSFRPPALRVRVAVDLPGAVPPIVKLAIPPHPIAPPPHPVEAAAVQLPNIGAAIERAVERRVKLLGREIKHITLLGVLPSTAEEVEAVFDGLAGGARAGATGYLRRVGDDLLAIEAPGVAVTILSARPGAASVAERILGRITAARPDEFTIVIGHNARGVLRCGDGSEIPLKSLFERLDDGNLKGMVLTCESVNYSSPASSAVLTTGRLEFDEIVAALTRTIAGGFMRAGRTDVGAFLGAFEENLTAVAGGKRRRVELVVKTVLGCSVVTVVVADALQDKQPGLSIPKEIQP